MSTPKWVIALLLSALMLALAGSSTGAQIDNTNGSYLDPDLGFLVTWNPDAMQAVSVANGGIILVHGGQQLMASPDRHATARECVGAQAQIDMFDAPLQFSHPLELDPVPHIDGLTERYMASYAWPDGIVHYAWFGCVSSGEGFLLLRLLSRDKDWATAVRVFQPVLDGITLPLVATPAASPSI